MPKFGIVLSGGMTRGAYEVGCLRAIEERFGKESICCISTSSIGTLTGYGYGVDRLDLVVDTWKNIDTSETGRFFPTFSGHPMLLDKIRNEMIKEGDKLCYKMYTSLWNFTEKKVEYIPFHELTAEQAREYVCASIAIPIFNKGVRINGNLMFDGAFLDNIPVFPMATEELDYIFCIYFDGCNYLFENEEFDKKIIKLSEFPQEKRLEMMFFNPKRFNDMVDFGYTYTNRIIERIFATDDHEQILAAIKEYEISKCQEYKKRLTADVVLNSVNTLTKRYAKRMSNREKLPKSDAKKD